MSDFESAVRKIQASVEKLGFKFSDTKILLGSHAHGDHMQGDALVKELTGAQSAGNGNRMFRRSTAADALEEAASDGSRDLHDGDEVKLGRSHAGGAS